MFKLNKQEAYVMFTSNINKLVPTPYLTIYGVDMNKVNKHFTTFRISKI